ncbi:hypothetical protein SAMN05880590_108122 [Rhizobium sp. RU35A]|nr:hypothetical protein SAMN05880590_108122 [Rhizobium sp. RU35A]
MAVMHPDDFLAMLEALDRGTLRGLRDRAMLSLVFAGGFTGGEVVGLDAGRDQTRDGRGWIEARDRGLLVTLLDRRGLRRVEIARTASDASCPVHAVESWLSFARIARGPLFRRVTGEGRKVGSERLGEREVARLLTRLTTVAGVRMLPRPPS